jgi:hypothetical protein
LSDSPAPVRSYQRIFRPDRRIHSVDGRPIPVPGGVPLRWLGYAAATALLVVLLSTGSRGLAILLAIAAATVARRARGRRAAVLVAAATLVAVPLASRLLEALDWPLRFLVGPALVATLATQPIPDGRRAPRYLVSWLALQLRPARRSLARALPTSGAGRGFAPSLRVEPDQHSPCLRRARVRGPATVAFAEPMLVARRRRRGVRVRPLSARRPRRREAVVESLELGRGEVAEVRA